MEHTYIIIDNDMANRRCIQEAIEADGTFEYVGGASSEKGAVDLILEQNPNLVFLNLDMPAESGAVAFQVHNELRALLERLPQFIVYAATEKYAIKAIRNRVLDYLMDPLTKGDIKKSILRFKKEQKSQFVSNHFMSSTLCLKSYGDYKFINTNDILYLKADNNTTDLIMYNGEVVNAFKTLKYFQKLLPQHFMRVHNSYIVNSHHVSRIHFGKNQCTVDNLNQQVPFSKSYRENVELLRDQLSDKSLIIA